jgi:hypothetical protein
MPVVDRATRRFLGLVSLNAFTAGAVTAGPEKSLAPLLNSYNFCSSTSSELVSLGR